MNAFDKHMTCLRGWKDGAGGREMNPDFVNHKISEFRYLYDVAYATGQKAAREYSAALSERYGYMPTPIRALKQKDSQ
jgi:hypothetical protein